MITALDDLSVLQNHDGVGVPHGGETVGDHEGGPFCHQTIHALLDVFFRSRIDGARRFIEQGMDALMAERTTFVIAHRLSTVRNATPSWFWRTERSSSAVIMRIS